MSGGSGIAVSCGVVRRLGSDLALLWLWYRPAAVAPIRPLAWEPPYASRVALKRQKTKKKKKKKEWAPSAGAGTAPRAKSSALPCEELMGAFQLHSLGQGLG